MSLDELKTQIQYVISECSMNYPAMERAVNDIAVAMYDTRLFGLYPVTFTFPDGHKEVILQMSGLLSMYFKNIKYNTPMSISFPLQYPDQAPIMYVCPTPDMRISQSCTAINPSTGLVMIDYLKRWTRHSSLAESMSLLSALYSTKPPLMVAPNLPPAQIDYPYVAYQAQALMQPKFEALPSLTGLTEDMSNLALSDTQLRTALEQMVEVKVNSALSRQHGELVKDIQTLTGNKQDLLKRTEAQRSSKAAQDATIQQVQSKLSTVSEDVKREKAWVEAHKDMATDPCAMLSFTHPLASQLVDAITKDQAADDTLTQLDAVLSGGKVSADAYVKELKNVSRQQYMERALAYKLHSIITQPQ